MVKKKKKKRREVEEDKPRRKFLHIMSISIKSLVVILAI